MPPWPGPPAARRAAELAARQSFGKLVAWLTARCGDVAAAILHGAADDLVPPSQWVNPADPQAATVVAIGSKAKAISFPCSDQSLDPGLIAFHNQAVTSTQYDDDALFASFGGVKHGPNAYNTAYIWPAVLALFGEQVEPENLLGALPEHPFAITTGEPPQTSDRGRMP